MGLIDDLEFCHCNLNRNLNELVRAAQGAGDAALLGCGDVGPERRQEAELYARALETWLDSSSAEPEIAAPWTILYARTVSLRTYAAPRKTRQLVASKTNARTRYR